METKSRYEIISDLEEKKAGLMNNIASISLGVAQLNRAVEQAQEQLEKFVAQQPIQEANLKDQLESIEKSLERLNSQKK